MMVQAASRAKFQTEMATSLALISGLDLGRVVRTLGGEYTGAWRDVDTILKEI